MKIGFKRLGVLVALVLAAACGTAQSAESLPKLSIDPAGISVSGLSSGGFMAVQVHVAYSATFRCGAGIVAGGPYYCSEGSFGRAFSRCMAHKSPIPVTSLAKITGDWAGGGHVDPVANLKASRVYIFSGTADETVSPAVANDLRTYYRGFVPEANIVYKNDIAAGHGMVTDGFGCSCDCAVTKPPYINNCQFDLAGEILKHLYGPLKARNNGAIAGRLLDFDQKAFVSAPGKARLAATGWVFIPKACADGATCRLHVVFHGCKQNAATLDRLFIRNAGYNRWADTNNIVVLYPQTGNDAPNGCWDWWGYTAEDFAWKTGPQMKAVKAMVDRLSGKTAPAVKR